MQSDSQNEFTQLVNQVCDPKGCKDRQTSDASTAVPCSSEENPEVDFDINELNVLETSKLDARGVAPPAMSCCNLSGWVSTPAGAHDIGELLKSLDKRVGPATYSQIQAVMKLVHLNVDPIDWRVPMRNAGATVQAQ
jgi:hypothetical protein